MKPSNHLLAALLLLSCAIAGAQPASAPQIAFNIDPQPLGDALNEFASQAGLQLLVHDEEIKVLALTVPKVTGTLTPEEALKQLLANSGLRYEFLNARTVAIRTADSAAPAQSGTNAVSTGTAPLHMAQQAGATAAASEEGKESTEAPQEKGIPEILVTGKRSLNTDIQRTRDDIQPYVTFDAEEIQRSGALNLEDFLTTRVPMNAQQQNSINVQGVNNLSNLGRIDLRGLGTNQTLILVDGRRIPRVSSGSDFGQPNINGIPLASIARIELLASTASAIYGGGATGGVVNIIMKRDYAGMDMKADYGNTFDSDVGRIQLSASGGFTLENGRTHIMLGAAHSEQNELLISDRDFSLVSRQLAIRNLEGIYSFVYPLEGSATNYCASEDLEFFPGFGYFGTCSGADLVFAGGAPLGSSFGTVPRGYAGVAGDDGAGLLGGAGRYDFGIPPNAAPLSSSPDMNSLSLNVRREFTADIEAFIDAYWDRLIGSQTSGGPLTFGVTAGSPGNPFQQDIILSVPMPFIAQTSQSELSDLRLRGGLIFRLPHGWSGSLEQGWARTRSAASIIATGAPTPFGESFLPTVVLQDQSLVSAEDMAAAFYVSETHYVNPITTTLSDTELRVGGPLLQLPAGPLTLSTLVERREERALGYVAMNFLPPLNETPVFGWTPGASQEVNAYYLEARAPLVTAGHIPLVHALELTASVRRDDYKTRLPLRTNFDIDSSDGPFPSVDYQQTKLGSTDYLLGIRYAISPDIAFRASRQTGFLAPSLGNLRPNNPNPSPATLYTYQDPARGNERVVGDPTSSPPGLITFISGGNPNLQPEESRSVSAGIIVTPRFAAGLRVSVDYTEIEKTQEIGRIAIPYLLQNEVYFPGRITRGVNLPSDPVGYPGVIIGIDTSFINISRSTLHAFDLQADYLLATERFGTWRIHAIGTRETEFVRQLNASSPAIDVVGYFDGPLEWRGNLGIVWDLGELTAGWDMQYLDSYRITYSGRSTQASQNAIRVLTQGSETVPSQTYHDVFATYRFNGARWPALLADTEITAGIQNVFDKSPPLVLDTSYGGGYSVYGDPRLRRYTLSVTKRFGK